MRRIMYVCIGFILMHSCGGSERVITNSGEVFELKGDSFYQNGKEVTDSLSDSEKERITSIMKKREEARAAAERKLEQLDKELEKLKARERSIKKVRKKVENKIEKRKAARQNFFDIKKELRALKADFKKIKKEKELSTSETIKWQERLEKLEKKLYKAELEVDN